MSRRRQSYLIGMVFFLFLMMNTLGFAQEENILMNTLTPNTVLHDYNEKLDEVVIKSQSIFEDRRINEKATSFIYLGPKTLHKFNYADITRLLRARSGVHLYEEDGWGFRPNISIRGSNPARSQGINLMEDGILAAPAPYSAPSAYYFPSIGRMQSVEIVKGSGQIVYGPNTVAGSLNLISTQIPNKSTFMIDASRGSFATNQIHAFGGGRFHNNHFGYSLEWFNQSSEGFLHTRRGERTGGFSLQDVVGKFLIDYSHGNYNLGKLQFKVQLSNQRDQHSYMGLSTQDFLKDPYLRYTAGANAGLIGDHQSYVAFYEIRPIKNLRINVDGYYNRFHRQLNRASADIFIKGNGKKDDVAKILRSPSSSNKDKEQVIKALNEGLSDNKDTIYYFHNNRNYNSYGVQFSGVLDIPAIQSVVRFGARFHGDSHDRFEPIQLGRVRNDNLEFFGTKPGNDRIAYAKAGAVYAQYQYTFKEKLTITAGLRYENVWQSTIDYKKGINKDRADRANHPFEYSDTNHYGALIPGISIAYLPIEGLTIFGGVHRGFSPAGVRDKDSKNGKTKEGKSIPPSNPPKPQYSINYELGVRYTNDFLKVEAIGYANRYTNMLATANVAGGTSSTADFKPLALLNVGAAIVAGFEGSLSVVALNRNKYVQIPISMQYTYFYGQYTTGYKVPSSNVTIELPTSVRPGSFFSLIPSHQARIDAQVNIVNKVSVGMSARYLAAVRLTPSANKIPPVKGATREERLLSQLKANAIPPNVIADFHLSVYPMQHLKVYAVIENLFNNKYVAGALPAGLRAGLPRFLKVGVTLNL